MSRPLGHAPGVHLLALALALAAASAVLAAEPPTPPTLPRRIPLEQALVESRPRIRLEKQALERVLAAMLDGSLPLEDRVKAIGLAALARLPETVPALIRILKQADTIDVKVAAVWALGEIGDPGAIPVLLQVHADASGPEPRLRYDKKIEFSAAGAEMTFVELIEDAIGRLGANVVAKYLQGLRITTESYQTASPTAVNLQRSALAVLVCVGDRDRRAVDAMTNVLRSPAGVYPPDFIEMAAVGLARVLVTRAKEFEAVRAQDKLADEITEQLADVLVNTRSGAVRDHIAGALNRSRPEHAVTALVRHFSDNSPEDVRKHTIEALALLRSREAVEALVWALEHEKSPDLRWRAALGLSYVGPSELALKALTKALADVSPDVKSAALAAVGRIGGKQAAGLVAPALRDPDPKVRAAAAKALGTARDKAAAAALVAAATDKDVTVRATVIAALAAIPTRESLEAIARAARDDDRQVRFTAAKVLTGIHLAESYDALLGLVSDADRKIRAEAANALEIARAQQPELLKQVLIKVILDPQHPASADACDLANFPTDTGIVAVLQKATADKRPAVRASALRMLHQMGVKP